MEIFRIQKQSKWWCIYFGDAVIDTATTVKLNQLLKRVTPNIVFGSKRVFLNVSESKWRNSFHQFQTKLSNIAKKYSLTPEIWQWGSGKTLAESWVQARWRTLSPDLLPLEAISDYLYPHGAHRKTAEEGRRFRLLRSLGMSSIQDILEIPEESLLSQCGMFICEFASEYFSTREQSRDIYLEKITVNSLLNTPQTFRLEDWIPEKYLEVG